MDEERGTQREIAKRYEDKVDYKNTRTPYRRTRLWIALAAFLGGLVAIYFAQRKSPPEFFNTGPLSRAHSNLAQGCVSCHVPESLSERNGGPPRFFAVLNDRVRKGAPSFERIDHACEQCHKQHTFHEPNVVANRSCSACHKEHQGPGGMLAVVSLDCASCHNNGALMQASAALGKQLPPTRFHLNPKTVNPRDVTAKLARPADGYTTTFASFSDGHPAFQLHRENLRDQDVLRFNHQRHFTGNDIPPTKSGAKLDCNYCHQAEANGRYMRPISFEAHCQECHSLQFDVRNPDFQLPHGDAQLVRTFLRTLPAQYGELARRQRGLTNESRINEFAAQQVRQLLTQFPNAEELERAVFFTGDPYKASQQLDPASRAKYTGCAFCHEVKQASGGSYATAEVTSPVMVERWLPHAQFSHATHETVSSCRDCHVAASSSRLTSDVLIPTKESCVRCHNPTGLAQKASECMVCHTYHAPGEIAGSSLTAASVSFKQMLLVK